MALGTWDKPVGAKILADEYTSKKVRLTFPTSDNAVTKKPGTNQKGYFKFVHDTKNKTIRVVEDNPFLAFDARNVGTFDIESNTFTKDRASISQNEFFSSNVGKSRIKRYASNTLKDENFDQSVINEALDSNTSVGGGTDEDSITTSNTLEIAAKRNPNTRTSYGNYCYPVTLRRGNQDRLKISVLQRDITDFKNLRLRGRRAPEKTIGSVVLPVPGRLNDNNRVDFKNGTLNPLEVAIGELGLTAFLNTGNAGEQAAKTVRNIFSDTGSLKGITASLFTGRLINRGANDIFARSQNAIINPNIETLFNGPTLRPFNFGFRLSPRDRGESIEVKKIIRMFKQSSAVQSSPSNFFLKTPNTFKLQFFDGSSTFSNSKFGNHDFLPKIKECALLGFGVDYTPDGTFMSYENSSMVSYDITFAFQELDPILNEDYKLLDNNTDQSIGF